MKNNLALNLELDGVRLATTADVPDLVRLGLTALKENPVEGMRISTEKLQDLARECVYNVHNYAIVSVVNGEVVAAVCALVHPMMVYERHQATVVQFYTTVPGEGIKLLRAFLKWARSLPKIKAIVFTLEMGASPRIGQLLEHMGLKGTLPVYVEWR